MRQPPSLAMSIHQALALRDWSALWYCYAALAIGALLIGPTAARYRRLSKFATANDCSLLGSFSSTARTEFLTKCGELVQLGFSRNKDLFRMRTDWTDTFVLSPHFTEELRGHESSLSAGVYTQRELLAHIPGMEPLGFAGTHRKFLRDVITSRLNRSLPRLPEFINREATMCLQRIWSDSTEWHDVPMYQSMLELVGQASIRTFLGPEMCRHKRWVEINTQYTVLSIGAVMSLRRFPRFLIPILHWFNPQAIASRALVNEARRILRPLYHKRRHEMASGKEVPADTMTWFEELATGPYDPAVAQLTLAVAAIHSTTDLICQALLDLTKHPGVIADLREELVAALKKDGFTQAAFSQLKLMDSVMKECQRLKPINRVFNKRLALADVTLSNGVTIPKGSTMAISSLRMTDPAVYPRPHAFDAYRFVKMAAEGPDKAKISAFASPSPFHTGFGYGDHACPGRTYVSLELKALFAHILLKYDWRLPEGYEPTILDNGFDTMTDITAKIFVRRRQEEIQL